MIAHRLSTVQNADVIVVLQAGQIVEVSRLFIGKTWRLNTECFWGDFIPFLKKLRLVQIEFCYVTYITRNSSSCFG